jgi:hypothetical protein
MSDEYDVYIEQSGFSLDLEIETGAAGPNQVSSSTATSLSGLLFGRSGAVGVASAAEVQSAADLTTVLQDYSTISAVNTALNTKLNTSGGVVSGLLSFSGIDSVGLRLKSLTSVQYGNLTPGNGDLFVDSTANRVDVRLNGVTHELLDTGGGQRINGTLGISGFLTDAAGSNRLRFDSNGSGATRVISDGSIFLERFANNGVVNLGTSANHNLVLIRNSATQVTLASGSTDVTGNLTATGTGTFTGALNANGGIVLPNNASILGAGVASFTIGDANDTVVFASGSTVFSTPITIGSGGPLFRNSSGTIEVRNNANSANGPMRGQSFEGTGTLNNYSFVSGNAGSATGDTWRFGKGWSGNYDTQLIFAYADNAAKVLIDSTGAITAFGGYYVNVPASSGGSIRPLQHGNSFLRFSAPASGIPGNNTTLEGWDSVFLNASTGNVRLRIGGADRLVLTNTDSTLTGNLTATGQLNAGSTAADTRSVYTSNNNFPLGVSRGTGRFYLGASSNTSTPDLVVSNNVGTERLRLSDSGDLTAIGSLAWSDVRIPRTTKTFRTECFESSLSAWQETSRQEASSTGARWSCLGATPIVRQTLQAAATDAATTQALANSIRSLLINFGFAN